MPGEQPRESKPCLISNIVSLVFLVSGRLGCLGDAGFEERRRFSPLIIYKFLLFLTFLALVFGRFAYTKREERQFC